MKPSWIFCIAASMFLPGCQSSPTAVTSSQITQYTSSDEEVARKKMDDACKKSEFSHQEIILIANKINDLLEKNGSKDQIEKLFDQLKSKSNTNDLDEECSMAKSRYGIIVESMANAARFATETNQRQSTARTRPQSPINCTTTNYGITSYTRCD